MTELGLLRAILSWAVFAFLLCDGCEAFSGAKATGNGCWFSRLANTAAPRSVSEKSGRRQLLQSDCGLQFGNEALSFASCQSVTSELGTDMTVHWTVVDSGNGNSTLRGAIDAAHSANSIDWAGFGFNPQLEMIGGNALVVKACSSCSSGASIDDYYLADYDAESVQPPSRLAVASKTAALSNGRLMGVFELSLNASGNALNDVGALYAAGPLASSGDLQQHSYQLAQALDLSPGLASSLGLAVAPASGAASSPGPAAEAPQAAASVSSAMSPQMGSVASSPSPANGQGCSVQFAGNNSQLAFAQCQSLTTASTANSQFRLLWSIHPSSTGNGSMMAGLISASASGWAGLGFAAQPGEMLGANAIIVMPCDSCPTGASADSYLLSSYQSSGVVAGTGSLTLTDVQAARSSDGTIQAAFVADLGASGINADAATDIIAAVGPVGGGGSLQSHPISNAYSGSVSLNSGAVAIQGSSSSSSNGRKPKVHAIMMIVAWGLLLPLGVVFPRCKEWGPVWFQLHRAIQTLGYLAGVAGAAVGVALGRPNGTNLENNHRIIGLVVFIMLTVQASAILWRPDPRASKLRLSWNALHWFIGGTAIFLAFANVFVGLHIAGQPAKWAGLYALGFALILLTWLGKLAYNLTVLRNRRRSASSLAPLKGERMRETEQIKGSSQDSNESSQAPAV